MQNKKGFTLIEMLVVIAIIGLLSSIVVVGLSSARAKARDARRLADVAQIMNWAELNYKNTGYQDGVLPIQNDPQGVAYVFEAVAHTAKIGACLETNERATGNVDCPAGFACSTGFFYCAKLSGY